MNRGGGFVLLLALVMAQTSATPIYKTKDESGNIVYTDEPLGRTAELVELPTLTIVPATPLTGQTQDAAGAEQEDAVPFRIKLLSPEPEATVRSNAGDVAVITRVNQPLGEGNRFEVLLDGTVRASNTVGTFALTGVDRGAHQIGVRLVDASGKVIARSAEHTFYLHRRSRLNP